MKKESAKLLIKEARKAAKKDIEATLINELNEMTSKLSQSSKKLDKKIQKGAKQLAKELARNLTISKESLASKPAAEEVAVPSAS
ncbi:hypothetical protein [Mucilaginibacter aquatilis]|uniref:Uncharacterized protein n=1 Tax=Mucilaginibacter aquatilis TaxID=1517760 RepID=A0A6I4I9A2_9SPHI|nr:hypothetical protein [Mucilaginibacter aquatilis]MVN90039.1 hypothetical protein [Mucilaginibacter aquatilis]